MEISRFSTSLSSSIMLVLMSASLWSLRVDLKLSTTSYHQLWPTSKSKLCFLTTILINRRGRRWPFGGVCLSGCKCNIRRKISSWRDFTRRWTKKTYLLISGCNFVNNRCLYCRHSWKIWCYCHSGVMLSRN